MPEDDVNEVDLDAFDVDDGDEQESFEDVDLAPSDVGDPPASVAQCIPADILAKYDVYSYRNAALILSQTRPEQFQDILEALRSFEITTTMIRTAGGNESEIPKLFSGLLRSKGWHETIVQADLLVRMKWKEQTGTTKGGKPIMTAQEKAVAREKYLDGHKVDYVKDRVAFDLEWNSKDQTFDRDLYAFSAFSQCGVIDVGVLVTRSASLNRVFQTVGPALNKDGEIEYTKAGAPRPTSQKYGASTTWMGKLLYRLNAGRNGPCPVLAFGIKPECVSDWSDPDA